MSHTHTIIICRYYMANLSYYEECITSIYANNNLVHDHVPEFWKDVHFRDLDHKCQMHQSQALHIHIKNKQQLGHNKITEYNKNLMIISLTPWHTENVRKEKSLTLPSLLNMGMVIHFYNLLPRQHLRMWPISLVRWCCLGNRLYNSYIPPWSVVFHIGVRA